jgi:alpha-tubulin suppressor-like RCC1 family protein
VKIEGLGGVRAIAAGANTAYALCGDGTVWAWGDGGFGALGARVGRHFVDMPVPVSGLRHVVAIAAGSYSAFAVLRDGTVWAWGRGTEGEIGDGMAADRSVATRVLRLTEAVEVAAGGDTAYAIDGQGRVWAWGNGDYGQLGDGYLVSLDEPTGVLSLGAQVHRHPHARERVSGRPARNATTSATS